MLYEPYGHGRADTTPARDELKIFGLELEISEVYDHDPFNNAIYDGVIETSDSDAANIQMEYEDQHDVQYELIFNADEKETLLKRLQRLNEYNIQDVICCNRNTSAHVHINRDYLDSLDISELEFYHAAEAVAPLIYTVSFRDRSSWDEWTPSNISIGYDVLERFNFIDDATPKNRGTYSDRYELCNVQNDATIEIRGFSNYMEFSHEYIKLYLDIVSELIPEIAAAMKGKNYKDNPETVLKIVKQFLDDREEITQRHVLDQWTDYKKILREYKAEQYKEAIRIYHSVADYLELARSEAETAHKLELITKMIRANKALKIDIINLNDFESVLDTIEDQNNKIFKNSVWHI